MTEWVAAVVAVRWQSTCATSSVSVKCEKGDGGSSPGCGCVRAKSMLERRSRGGVPVFIRPMWNPSSRRLSDIFGADTSPERPPS